MEFTSYQTVSSNTGSLNTGSYINPTEYSIKQVVDLIVEHMGFKGKVKWLTDKPNGQHRKPSSNAKLLSIIGEYNFTTLEKGLKESIEWFILKYPNVRK